MAKTNSELRSDVLVLIEELKKTTAKFGKIFPGDLYDEFQKTKKDGVAKAS